jgi:hypothetical protein
MKYIKSMKYKCGLTQRAADVWESARFTSIFLALGFSTSQTLSIPAHTQLTQTVRQPVENTKTVFESPSRFAGYIQD